MSEVAKQLATSTKRRKALGGLAVTLALVGGAEVKSNQVAEAQTESYLEHIIECPAGQNPHWVEDSDGDERPDANEMKCDDYVRKCMYGKVAVWFDDNNGDNQPGPSGIETSCRTITGCWRKIFLPSDRTTQLFLTNVITGDQFRFFKTPPSAAGWCLGDPPTSLEDFGPLSEAAPWLEQLFIDNPWLGETKVPGYDDLKPWAVEYVNSITPEEPQDTTEPEPTTTTDSTVVDQEDSQTPEEPQVTTEPETTTTTDSTVVEQEDSQTPEEPQDTTEPETTTTTTTTDSTVVEQEDSQTPEEPQDTTEPEPTTTTTTTTTTGSTVVDQEDSQTPEETQDTTEPELTTTTDSTVVEQKDSQTPEETQDTTEPEPTTTTDSTVVEQEDTDGGRTELIVGGVVAASVLSLTAVTTYLRLRRRRSL